MTYEEARDEAPSSEQSFRVTVALSGYRECGPGEDRAAYLARLEPDVYTGVIAALEGEADRELTRQA